MICAMSKIEVKGNKNQIYSDIKRSNINTQEQSSNHNVEKKWIGLASLCVAVLGLIVACIANWEKIIQLFK